MVIKVMAVMVVMGGWLGWVLVGVSLVGLGRLGCALDRLKARGATTGIKVELLVSDEERRSFGYASLSRSCNGNSKRLCYQ